MLVRAAEATVWKSLLFVVCGPVWKWPYFAGFFTVGLLLNGTLALSVVQVTIYLSHRTLSTVTFPYENHPVEDILSKHKKASSRLLSLNTVNSVIAKTALSNIMQTVNVIKIFFLVATFKNEEETD